MEQSEFVVWYLVPMEESVVPGFSWDEGDLLMRFVAKPDKNHPGEVLETWEPCLPFNVVPLRALREGADIKIVNARITFPSGRSKDVSIPASVVSANRPAPVLEGETGLDVTHKEAVALAEFVEVIVNEAKGCVVPEVQVLTSAEWSGDELRVPGRLEVSPRKAYAELAKYGGTAGEEEAAKVAWREVLQYAAHPGNEKLLLALGMPLGSIYAARLRQRPYSLGTATFALHLTGDSGKGKTQTAVAAMMTLGDAYEKSAQANLYRTWDMSAQAPVALAHQLGILPILLDEAAASQKTPEEFTQSLFALAQGTERQRATQHGDLDDVDRWECCILSTGEMRLTAKSGLVGVRRRIQELYTPFAPPAHSDAVFKLASEFHGWPLQWLAEKPDVPGAAKLLPKIEHSFEDAEITWLNAAAKNLAVCGLGVLMLSRHIDGSLTPAQVHQAVINVVLKAGQAAVSEGVDAGAKLLKAVWGAVAMRPNSFPAEDLPPGGTREREGILFRDGTIGVMDDVALRRIARDAGLPDYQAGLRLLKDQEYMVCEKGRDQVMRTFLHADGSKDRKRVYVFKPPSERDR